jgi:D-alanyl-D-alanine dipeptidase
MQAHGFNDYFSEWWHFVLADEPYPDTYFDFQIVPRQ